MVRLTAMAINGSYRGYARVSTNGQDYNGHLAALKSAGCNKVFKEKVSGARSDRPELAKMVKALEPGDIVVVARLDRLAHARRGTCSTCSTQSARLVPASSRWPTHWADTTTPHGRLMLTVLGGLAEFERSLIITRTGDGRERAKARGVKFGRPRKLNAHQRQEALARIDAGEALVDIAKTFGVDATTIGRLKP
jgi:DNA invertase Pin-like site-specific DNA recombinase